MNSSGECLILLSYVIYADRRNKGKDPLLLCLYHKLSLSLFVLRILTDYSDRSFSSNNLAFFANWFYRCSNLHLNSPFKKRSDTIISSCFPFFKSFFICLSRQFFPWINHTEVLPVSPYLPEGS